MGRRSMTKLVPNGCGMQDNKIAGDWLVALLHRHSQVLRDGVHGGSEFGRARILATAGGSHRSRAHQRQLRGRRSSSSARTHTDDGPVESRNRLLHDMHTAIQAVRAGGRRHAKTKQTCLRKEEVIFCFQETCKVHGQNAGKGVPRSADGGSPELCTEGKRARCWPNWENSLHWSCQGCPWRPASGRPGGRRRSGFRDPGASSCGEGEKDQNLPRVWSRGVIKSMWWSSATLRSCSITCARKCFGVGVHDECCTLSRFSRAAVVVSSACKLRPITFFFWTLIFSSVLLCERSLCKWRRRRCKVLKQGKFSSTSCWFIIISGNASWTPSFTGAAGVSACKGYMLLLDVDNFECHFCAKWVFASGEDGVIFWMFQAFWMFDCAVKCFGAGGHGELQSQLLASPACCSHLFSNGKLHHDYSGPWSLESRRFRAKWVLESGEVGGGHRTKAMNYSPALMVGLGSAESVDLL